MQIKSPNNSDGFCEIINGSGIQVSGPFFCILSVFPIADTKG